MKKIVLLITVIILIWACQGSDNPTKKQLSGAKVYSLYCTQCHGGKGNLSLNGASDFTTSKLTLEERIDVIANGRKTMLPYKNQLRKAEIKAVAEYTIQLQN